MPGKRYDRQFRLSAARLVLEGEILVKTLSDQLDAPCCPHARATALRYFFPSGILSIAAKNRTRVVRSRSQGITTATQQPAPRGEGARACQRERHTIAAIFALLLGRP